MKIGNLLVLGSIAINAAVVVCAQFAVDSVAYFKQAFPYIVLVAFIGGVGALLDWRTAKRMARLQFFREGEVERSESNE